MGRYLLLTLSFTTFHTVAFISQNYCFPHSFIQPVCFLILPVTANKRIDWGIEKTHGNDAVCITGLLPDTCEIKEWTIKPMRRQSKAKTDHVLGIKE